MAGQSKLLETDADVEPPPLSPEVEKLFGQFYNEQSYL